MNHATVWKTLWDYDPNGLIAFNHELQVQLVNPAFCRMFRQTEADLLGQPAHQVLGELSDLEDLCQNPTDVRTRQIDYPAVDLFVRQVMFAIEEEQLIACILVDLTDERDQIQRVLHLKREAIDKVHRVVDKQMQVAQEIASLLGETTAETKASLLKLVELLDGKSS